jgi:hypothetical protein
MTLSGAAAADGPSHRLPEAQLLIGMCGFGAAPELPRQCDRLSRHPCGRVAAPMGVNRGPAGLWTTRWGIWNAVQFTSGSSQVLLPFRPTPSTSIVGRTMQEIGLLETYPAATAARRAPNILIVLIDDAGPGLPTTLMRARGFRPSMAAIYERKR